MLKMVHYPLIITLSIQNLELNQQTMAEIGEQIKNFLNPIIHDLDNH